MPVSGNLNETGRISVLPRELVNQIAAGEVVERPASVVKELVENSLDAGASTIEIVLLDGGRRLIEVSDDGIGMSEQDAVLALRRHATSKIQTFEDLLSVSTLGFRGEALPSIASVSRFRMITADGSGPGGHELTQLQPDEPPDVRPAARDRGTTVVVEDLFVHVPARRKFLKTAAAELRRITSVVSSYAIPNFGVSFRLTHNERLVLDLPATHSERERAIQILGARCEPHLREIDFGTEACHVHGFVARGAHIGGRKHQFTFVNGRMVRDRVITQAVRKATDAFDDSRQPALILDVRVRSDEVDVNVHPAKTEVRFRDSGRIFVTVERGVRTALGAPESGAGLMTGELSRSHQDSSTIRERNDGMFDPRRWDVPEPEYRATPLFRQGSIVQPPRPEPAAEVPGIGRLGDLEGRVIGQYRHSYIVVDIPAGLRLIDQHAAHERVLYDRIEASRDRGPESQRMLSPVVYDCGAAEAALLDSRLDELRNVGFEIERFSAGAFGITAVPVILSEKRILSFLGDAASDEESGAFESVRHRIVASLACQAAIKVHRPLSGAEMSDLAASLLQSSNPFACPHGRPIIVDIAHVDVEKHFHRR